MRTLTFLTILGILTACAGVEPDRVISRQGGVSTILANGVCVQQYEESDRIQRRFVDKSRCGL